MNSNRIYIFFTAVAICMVFAIIILVSLVSKARNTKQIDKKIPTPTISFNSSATQKITPTPTWYDQFPISNVEYYAYFDTADKKIHATLFTNSSNTESTKQIVIQKVKELGVDSVRFPIIFTIKEPAEDGHSF